MLLVLRNKYQQIENREEDGKFEENTAPLTFRPLHRMKKSGNVTMFDSIKEDKEKMEFLEKLVEKENQPPDRYKFIK